MATSLALPRSSTECEAADGCAPEYSAAPDHRQESGRGGPCGASRRSVEGRLCRLRDRDDGILPADVAARRNDRKAAQGARRLFRADDRAGETGYGGVERAVRRRSAGRRGGNEGVSTCRSGWSPGHEKKKR